MYRSYLLRLNPTKLQVAGLEAILSLSCDLYNAALQERRDAWSISRKKLGYYSQTAQITEMRKDDAGIRAVALEIAREPLRRVDLAFSGFFRRCKAGEKPGYPRFKAKARYDSFAFGDSPRLDGNRLMIPNFGGIKTKFTRDIIGKIKRVIVKRIGKKWVARIVCDVGPAPEKVAVSTATGIDVGLTTFATLSDGTKIENPRWMKKFEYRIARANRVLARKQRRSNNRTRARLALARAHQRAADARRNFTHHVSKWLVANYDLIAYEKLNITGMVRGNLAKSILDAAWGELVWQITYKAESAGKWAVPVNPKNTTQMCSGCGVLVKKTLSDRTHSCPHCGLEMCRDRNAAINVLALGMSAAGASLQNMCPRGGT